MFPFTNLALRILIVIGIILLLEIRYRFRRFNRLASLPSAHPSVHRSNAWIESCRKLGKESRSIQAAHALHGPIVRLGPSEVSITSYESLRTVYYSKWTRTNWVLPFRNYKDTANLVTMIDPQQHASRRRLLSNIFSKSFIIASADFAGLSHVILFDRFLPFFKTSSRLGGKVDVFEMSRAVAVDMMSAYQVGIQSALNFTGKGQDMARLRHLKNGDKKLRNLNGAGKAIEELEIECIRTCVKAEKDLVLRSLSNYIEPATTPTTFPVVFTQLRRGIGADEIQGPFDRMLHITASEMLDNLEAARVGIGIIVTLAMYRLSQQHHTQIGLRKHLQPLAKVLRYPGSITFDRSTLREIDEVKLLDAIVMETLRLHPSAPGPQFRLVPKDGVVLDGYFIPAGTWISTSPYCLQQDARVFPMPHVWQPERWLDESAGVNHSTSAIENSEDTGHEQNPRKWFWAFGRGDRMCIGSNFSMIAIKLILAAVYFNFDSSLVNDEPVEQRDEMPADPVDGKLELIFQPVDTS